MIEECFIEIAWEKNVFMKHLRRCIIHLQQARTTMYSQFGTPILLHRRILQQHSMLDEGVLPK